MIELEQTTDTLSALDRPHAHANATIDQLIPDALMVSLVIEMKQVLVHDAAQVRFAEQDYPAETFLPDQPAWSHLDCLSASGYLVVSRLLIAPGT